jgi:hypothetical protein
MAITVRHGVNSLSLDNLAGKSVGEVRDQVADVLNVPDSAQVRVNGTPSDDESVLSDGACVEFVKTAGEKGGR